MDVDRLLPDEPLVPQSSSRGTFLLTVKHGEDHRHADAAYLALREARIKLWADLWQRSEDVDRLVAERTADLRAENTRLRRTVRNLRRDRTCRT